MATAQHIKPSSSHFTIFSCPDSDTDFCFWLSAVEPSVILCSCSLSESKCDVLWVLKYISAYLGCKEILWLLCLFKLLWKSFSELSHSQVLYGCFFFCTTVVHDNPMTSAFLKPSLSQTHNHTIIKTYFFPFLVFDAKISLADLHLYRELLHCPAAKVDRRSYCIKLAVEGGFNTILY